MSGTRLSESARTTVTKGTVFRFDEQDADIDTDDEDEHEIKLLTTTTWHVFLRPTCPTLIDGKTLFWASREDRAENSAIKSLKALR